MKNNTRTKLINILFVLSPVLTLGYLTLNHFGVIDKMTSIDKLKEGNRILSTPSGFPNGFINRTKKSRIFKPMLKLIESNTDEAQFHKLKKLGAIPEMISIVGHTIEIEGLDKEWPKEYRSAYSPYHSIVVFFKADNSNEKIKNYLVSGSNQLHLRVAYLGQIDQWISEKKVNFNFWVGGVSILLISIAGILLRINLQKKAYT